MNQKESNNAFELLSQDEMISIDAGGWFDDVVEKATEILSVIPTPGKFIWTPAYYNATHFPFYYNKSGLNQA